MSRYKLLYSAVSTALNFVMNILIYFIAVSIMTQFLPHFTILLLKLRPRIAEGSRLGLYYGCSLGIIRVYLV